MADDYLERMFIEWEEKKKETRKKLPQIYDNSDQETKTIIEMLIETEYQNAILIDNNRRKNGGDGIYADQYKNQNKEIMERVFK